MEQRANQKVKEASITATIFRADGTVEQLDVIGYYHRNPLRRLWWRIQQFRRNRNGNRSDERGQGNHHVAP